MGTVQIGIIPKQTMKLSQNLLGLAGLAVADYACCPYDDYGIVDPACGLTEKTPFNVPSDATDDWNNNMCKAWEANVDATYDGHDGGCGAENWGGCGFQRHFAWGRQQALDAQFPSIQLDTANANPHLGVWAAAGTTRTFGDAADTYKVGGKPFLGGICKPFIPVTAPHITQVTVSGVHVSGQAQFPAKIIKSGTPDEEFEGTAFCFSVVNIQEFKTNTNLVGNGNVAGAQEQLLTGNAYDFNADIFAGATSLQRQLGRDFGATVDGYTTTQQGEMVEDGANFDVVAHFDSEKCNDVWNGVDMQLDPDVNFGGTIDYPLNPLSGFSHAHTDLQDKRHNTAPIVTGGPYTQSGDYLVTSAPNSVRWPNFGAWAGYNSAVACANTGSANDHYLHTGDARKAVMSVGSADFRSKAEGVDCTGNWAEYQFNIRQVGTGVVVCGPGELPDTDSKRCTWNWNYNAGPDFGASSTSDAEGFFDRSEQLDFAVWTRKRRAAVDRNALQADQPVNAGAVLSSPAFTLLFKNYAGNTVTPTLTQLSHNVGTVNGSGEPTATGIRIDGQTVSVECVNSYTNDQTNNQRDLFPSCFVGDEIHLKASYDANTALPTDTPAGDANRAFISPWLSKVNSVANFS